MTMAIETEPPDADLFDARKPRIEIGPLRRLAAWVGAAAIALAVLVLTAQTETGSQRLESALAAFAGPASAPKVAENDRLLAQVAMLAADRDRLTARIASLENSLEDVTGSIKRQAAAGATAPRTETTVANASPPPTVAPPDVALVPTPVRTETFTPPAAPPPPAQAVSPAPAAVPMPPTRVAAAPADEPAAEAPKKPEIGVDIGGAPNLDVLGMRWAAVKANYGPLLAGLHPLAAQNRRPGATDLRLLVGPLPNAAAAAQLCARFAAVKINCRTTKFDGERMAQR